jgi:hypothetical protein
VPQCYLRSNHTAGQRRRQEINRLLYWPGEAIAQTVQTEPRADIGPLPALTVGQDPLRRIYSGADQYRQLQETTHPKSPIVSSEYAWEVQPVFCLEQHMAPMYDIPTKFAFNQ